MKRNLYIRDCKGQFVYGVRLNLAFIAFLACLFLGVMYSIIYAPIANSRSIKSAVEFKEGSFEETWTCEKTSKGFTCNDPEKIGEYVNSIPPAYSGKKVVVTGYSRKDSCHFPKTVGGKVLCLTAIGRDTKEGVTVACPKKYKLGTKIHIEGIGERTCEDRTADWVQSRNGETFDLFMESHTEALKWGKKKLIVTVL